MKQHCPKASFFPKGKGAHAGRLWRDHSLSRSSTLLSGQTDHLSRQGAYQAGDLGRVVFADKHALEFPDGQQAHVRLLPVWEFQGVFVRENDPSQITCLVSALSGEVIGLPG